MASEHETPTPKQNLTSILDRSSRLYEERVAIEFEDREVTYGELRANSLRIANGLLDLGIEDGDRVGVLLNNSIEWVEVYFAIAYCGAICVPVNILLRPPEIQHQCDDSDMAAIIVDDAGSDSIAHLDEPPAVVVHLSEEAPAVRSRCISYVELASASDSPPTPGPSLMDLASLYYSSGTTGKPKAAAHTHSSILWNNFHQVHDFNLTSSDRYLVIPSLSWAAGLHDIMLATLWVGGTAVIAPTGGATSERIGELIQSSRATNVLLVPVLLNHIIQDPEAQRQIRASALRFVLTGSAPVPLPAIETWQELFPETALLQAYGMSEFPTIATTLHDEEAMLRAGWAGRPTSVTEIAVKDSGGTIRASGEGEVLIRSLAAMEGYWGLPEQSSDAFADGWLHTGDMGMIDEEGYLKITGRVKEMVISGGLNVYPNEVEAVLFRHPGIRDAAVVGIPDAKWGEVPVAVIVPSEQFDIDSVKAYCREHLATYKCPKEYVFWQEPLPRNPIGKLLKQDIQSSVSNARGQQGR